MSRKPIGVAPMSNAERSRRRREKAKALRDAALMPDLVAVANGSETIAAPLRYGDPHNGKSGPDYPRMLYHPDGRTIIVDTPELHARLTPDGWVITPLAVHRQRLVWHHGIPRRQ